MNIPHPALRATFSRSEKDDLYCTSLTRKFLRMISVFFVAKFARIVRMRSLHFVVFSAG
jgi:hypothetical protein